MSQQLLSHASIMREYRQQTNRVPFSLSACSQNIFLSTKGWKIGMDPRMIGRRRDSDKSRSGLTIDNAITCLQGPSCRVSRGNCWKERKAKGDTSHITTQVFVWNWNELTRNTRTSQAAFLFSESFPSFTRFHLFSRFIPYGRLDKSKLFSFASMYLLREQHFIFFLSHDFLVPGAP